MKYQLTCVFSALSMLCASLAHAEVTRSTSFSMPSQVQGTITETDCQNHQGPWITLDGVLRLGGLRLQLTFQNNVKGTHSATVTYSSNVVLVPLAGEITLPKQPVQGGVGGNPHIWIQFYNNGGNLTDEIYLGRCVQGLSISPEFLLAAIASADIEVFDCNNSPGPFITVGGSLRLAGLNARFIFRNNFGGTHEAVATSEVSLIANGSTIEIPKQPVLGGAGGNPIISIQFLQGDGTPIGIPIKLGRCVQL